MYYNNACEHGTYLGSIEVLDDAHWVKPRLIQVDVFVADAYTLCVRYGNESHEYYCAPRRRCFELRTNFHREVAKLDKQQ